jgi:hypothetical protein
MQGYDLYMPETAKSRTFRISFFVLAENFASVGKGVWRYVITLYATSVRNRFQVSTDNQSLCSILSITSSQTNHINGYMSKCRIDTHKIDTENMTRTSLRFRGTAREHTSLVQIDRNQKRTHDSKRLHCQAHAWRSAKTWSTRHLRRQIASVQLKIKHRFYFDY